MNKRLLESSPLANAALEIVRAYERERREQILRFYLPAAFVLGTVVVIVLGVAYLTAPTQAAREVYIPNIVEVAVVVVLVVGTWLIYRRGRVSLAATLLLAIVGAGIALNVPAYAIKAGIDPLSFVALALFGSVIVLAGLLGNRRAILITTFAMNVASVVFLTFLPVSSSLTMLFDRQRPLLIALTLVVQWTSAILILIVWYGYRRTLGAIGDAYERAKQLDRLKDEFIANVNHELRTPIMALQTYIETMRVAPEALTPEQLRQGLDQASALSESLTELVESILSVRRIDHEAETLTIEPFALRPVIEASAQLIEPQEGDELPARLSIFVDLDLTVKGDRIRTQQIMTNLLSNAVKYSEPGTPIVISAELIRQTSAAASFMARREPSNRAMVEIKVRDLGLGIPPEQLSLLFNRFVRLPRDLASKVPGTGIGLYLCYVMASAMGGTISAESTGVPGEGSTFALRLPAATE